MTGIFGKYVTNRSDIECYFRLIIDGLAMVYQYADHHPEKI